MYTVSGKNVAHGLWFLKAYAASGFAGEVVENESAVVENAIFILRSLYIFRMKFPTNFTHRNLHGFALFRVTARLLLQLINDFASIYTKQLL